MTTEERIVLAAINCVEKYGYTGVTTRRIAAEADVNLAAVYPNFSTQLMAARTMRSSVVMSAMTHHSRRKSAEARKF